MQLICVAFTACLALASASSEPYPPQPTAYGEYEPPAPSYTSPKSPSYNEYEPQEPQYSKPSAYNQYESKLPQAYTAPTVYPAPQVYEEYTDEEQYQPPTPVSKTDLLSNGEGTVILLTTSSRYCTYKHRSTYAITSRILENTRERTTENEEDGSITFTREIAFRQFASAMSEAREGEPSAPTAEESSASNAANANSKNGQKSNKAKNSGNGKIRGWNYYSYCSWERHLALCQLSGKHENLKKAKIEGWKIRGGYANVPEAGTRMFTSTIRAPAGQPKSTYEDQYGPVGPWNQYQRRSHYRGEQNAIFQAWGWAKFCKPSYNYDRTYSNYGYQRRSGAYGYGEVCWKEAIDISFELDYPRKSYVGHIVRKSAYDNEDVLVGAVPLKPKYTPRPLPYGQPAYPQYSKPAYNPPSYEEPQYEEPSYKRPPYKRPSYKRPSNKRPTYSAPDPEPYY